jgi:uracil-DNA glycosylase family 4
MVLDLAPAVHCGAKHLSTPRNQYLESIGIPVWVERRPADASQPAEQVGGHAIPVRELGWDELREAVRACTKCELHRSRRQTVFGVGRKDASLLVIGEAPGQEEDRQGEPFVGRAGQLLNAMMRSIGLSREEIYIANILKCRPPNNRDPKPEEAATCTPFLDRQVDLIEPRVVLALGRIAAQWLLQSDRPVGRLRGEIRVFPGRNIPLVVSYHPAYLLRSPAAKAKAWQDLCLVKGLLEKGS